MFYWKDYGENSLLFTEGMNTSVAVLRYKDFRLTDSITGKMFKIKSSCLDEAKVSSVKTLVGHWEYTYKNLGRVLG